MPHDTIEDAETTPEELEALFGRDVRVLVLEEVLRAGRAALAE